MYSDTFTTDPVACASKLKELHLQESNSSLLDLNVAYLLMQVYESLWSSVSDVSWEIILTRLS